MSLAIIQQALRNEVLPLLRGGGTRAISNVVPIAVPEDAESTTFFEISLGFDKSHLHHEWMWLLSGEAHLKLNERIHAIHPGDFCFLPPLLQHADVYSRQTPAYRSLWFSAYSDQVFIALFEYQPFGKWRVPIRCSIADGPELRSVRGHLHSELTRQTDLSVEIVQGLLILLLGQLVRALQNCSLETTSITRGTIANRVQRFLSEHYHEHLTLEQIARAAYCSPHHTARLFRKQTGHTIFQALARLRVERATQLLIEDKLAVSVIATAVGYRDPDHFARVFRQHTGLSPSRYGKYSEGEK